MKYMNIKSILNNNNIIYNIILSSQKYRVFYIDYNEEVIDYTDYANLNKAITDVIYWKNHISTKYRISEIWIINKETEQIVSIIPNS